MQRLTARGHRVTVIAPSAERQAVAEAGRRVQAVLTGERETVFLPDDPYPRYFFAGATYAVRESRSLKLIAAPADLIANIDVLLEAEDLDLLHLHEPFVPGLGWTALRYAGCPLVATFHANPERTAPFLATRPRLRRLFDSLDAAIASSAAARDAAALTFPGAYHVIPPGVDLQRFGAGDGERREPGPLRLLFAGVESRRKGLGVLLRALRYLDDRAPELSLQVCGDARQERRYARLVPPAFAGRVTFLGRVPDDGMPDLYRQSRRVLRALAGPRDRRRRPPRGDGRRGRRGGLPAARLRRGRAPRGRRTAGGPAAAPGTGRQRCGGCWTTRACEHASRPRPHAPCGATIGSASPPRPKTCTSRWRGGGGNPCRAAAASSASCSRTSTCTRTTAKDCAMPVADILERAREVGLDVVAITDHDSAAGGLEAREIADRYGVRVIVGEEVKSGEGEVIGLFLERTIPGGMSFAETVAAIREQGGLVYVPHPFDRLHTIPVAAGPARQRRRHRRHRGLQLQAGLPRLQRAGGAVRAALPHPRGCGQRRPRAARHRHRDVRHRRLQRAGRPGRRPRREPRRAPSPQLDLPAVAQVPADHDERAGTGRGAG